MKSDAPVYSCRISRDGGVEAFGDESLIFPYWSFTKTVIAICVLKLAERGRIDLDRCVADQNYTLRQLLNHTSGLPDYGTLSAYRRAVRNDEEPWPRDALLQETLAQGTLFAPGRGWAYSNVGYMLAREAVEEASGRSFSELSQEIICDRLGVTSVELATSRNQFSRVVWDGARRYHPGWVYHGCLTGTATDAARILHGLVTGKLLGAAMLAQMMRRRPLGGAIEGRPWTDCGYALGLMSGRVGAAGRAVGHSGGGPFCVNAVYHFPDCAGPVTVASFAEGHDEGVAEFTVVRLADAA